jgi:hypothetical protein
MAHAVKLIHMPKRLKFETGSFLSRKGEMMPHFIIILSGTAEVREQELVEDHGRPSRLASEDVGYSARTRKSQALTVGAYLGLHSMLASTPENQTIQAVTPVHCLTERSCLLLTCAERSVPVAYSALFGASGNSPPHPSNGSRSTDPARRCRVHAGTPRCSWY